MIKSGHGACAEEPAGVSGQHDQPSNVPGQKRPKTGNSVLNENGLTGIEMSWLSVFSFLIGAEFTSGLRVPMYKSLKG